MQSQPTCDFSQTHKLKVVFLGDRAVGKTSIIKRYTRNEFTEKQNPTVGIDYMFKTVRYGGKQWKLELWDTAGQEKYRSLVKSYLKDADCALFVYDITQIQSYYHLVDWLATFNESGHGHPLCLIVGNKVDLRDLEHSHDAIDVNFITNRQLKRLEKYEHVDVSAKDGVGVEELFMRVLAGVHQRREEQGQDGEYGGDIVQKSRGLEIREKIKSRCCMFG